MRTAAILPKTNTRKRSISAAIRAEVAVDDVILSARTLSRLGIIVNELLTNSVKYAFPARPEGRVRILLSREGSGFSLEYSDDGVGLPADRLKKLELVTSSTTKDLRFYMLKWFEKQTGPIEVKRDDNWKVIPEDWAAAGKANSYPMMYPSKK